jgi:hypothetical protein
VEKDTKWREDDSRAESSAGPEQQRLIRCISSSSLPIAVLLDLYGWQHLEFAISRNSPSSANRIDTEISSNCDRKQGAAVAHTLWPSRTLPGRFGDGLCWHGAQTPNPKMARGEELSLGCVILRFYYFARGSGYASFGSLSSYAVACTKAYAALTAFFLYRRRPLTDALFSILAAPTRKGKNKFDA